MANHLTSARTSLFSKNDDRFDQLIGSPVFHAFTLVCSGDLLRRRTSLFCASKADRPIISGFTYKARRKTPQVIPQSPKPKSPLNLITTTRKHEVLDAKLAVCDAFGVYSGSICPVRLRSFNAARAVILTRAVPLVPQLLTFLSESIALGTSSSVIMQARNLEPSPAHHQSSLTIACHFLLPNVDPNAHRRARTSSMLALRIA